jgi:hypothetical protein
MVTGIGTATDVIGISLHPATICGAAGKRPDRVCAIAQRATSAAPPPPES